MKMKNIMSVLVVTSILSVSTLASVSHADAHTLARLSESDSSQESKNPQDEIISRMTIIKIAEGSDDDVLIAEADIARSELAGYQNQRAEDAVDTQPKAEAQTQVQAKPQPNEYRFRRIIVHLGGVFGGFLIGFGIRSFLWKT